MRIQSRIKLAELLPLKACPFTLLASFMCVWTFLVQVISYFFRPGRIAQSVARLTEESEISGSGWSGGAKVLGKLPVPGRPTILITVGQGPTALAVGAGGGCLDIFTLIYPFSSLSPSLWETVRYRLKYCLKGPLNRKQPTNHRYPVRPHIFMETGHDFFYRHFLSSTSQKGSRRLVVAKVWALSTD